MRSNRILKCAAVLAVIQAFTLAQERSIDPTFLRRHLPDLKEQPSDFTAPGCHYRPAFGAGDPDASLLRGIMRYGEVLLDPKGKSARLEKPSEELVYVVLQGGGELEYDGQRYPVRGDDFMYVPPGVIHSFSNDKAKPCRIIAMGFRVKPDTRIERPKKLMIANISEAKKEVVAGHPPSTLYQLLMGDTRSTRDRLAAAQVLTSLFIMEFAPGGTNHPHHHESEEEIYLVLDGHGEMVAGSGANGVEGKYPARAGDAYFFRLNCTVGFYAGNKEGEEKARILAVRSLFPFKCP
jgi:mannose-6-phosphate isomerase-like protein (cupin superfamily)